MNYSLAVQVLHGCKKVPSEIVHRRLRQAHILLKKTLQIASDAVFQDEP